MLAVLSFICVCMPSECINVVASGMYSQDKNTDHFTLCGVRSGGWQDPPRTAHDVGVQNDTGVHVVKAEEGREVKKGNEADEEKEQCRVRNEEENTMKKGNGK